MAAAMAWSLTDKNLAVSHDETMILAGAGPVIRVSGDAMMKAYKSMDFNSRHGAGREGRIGDIVLQILRDM